LDLPREVDECETRQHVYERCDTDYRNKLDEMQKMAFRLKKGTDGLDTFECVFINPLACLRRSANIFIDSQLGPCHDEEVAITATPCKEPDCTFGSCKWTTGTMFGLLGRLRWLCIPDFTQPPGSCGASPGCRCDYDTCTANCGTTTTTTTCPTCFSESCAACGPQTALGTPLPPGTGFGIFSTRPDCNLCCEQPVNVCHTTDPTHPCCVNRFTAGDLYCCPESPGTCPASVCPQ